MILDAIYDIRIEHDIQELKALSVCEVSARHPLLDVEGLPSKVELDGSAYRHCDTCSD